MNTSDIRGTRASDHLDLVRGAAAVAVLFEHARVMLMRPADPDLSAPLRAVYFLTNHGHAAVMVFFVLSGYLVGGGALRAIAKERWAWREYLLARGVRLWIVLIPALLLTLAWDGASLALARNAGIEPSADSGREIIPLGVIEGGLTTNTFVGNLLFVQTIRVQPFGSNMALWSLANEGWYYLIFPCLVLALAPRQSVFARVGCGIAAVGMLSFVGWPIALLFPAWLLGVVVGLLPAWRAGPIFTSVCAAPFIVAVVATGRSEVPSQMAADFAVAITFALFLYALLQDRAPGGTGSYSRTATTLAGCSYTLYLTHLPVLVCLRSLWTLEHPWAPDLAHWGALGVVCAGCVVYALLLARLTEAKTERVRNWLKRRLSA